ncbi:hypothetical protein LguiA_008459 [Lonicera macranthoides]
MEEAIIAAIVVELGSAAFKEIGAALGVTKQLEELKETLESINYTLAGAQVLQQFLSVSNNPFVFRSVMGRKIKGIRESLSRIKADKDVCDTSKGGGGKGVSLANVTHTVSDTFPCCESSDVIGRDEDAYKIAELLSKDSGSVSAIPIVGIGGIGKTALTFKVYSDNAIVMKFDLKLWVSAKEDFKDRKNLLRKILASASKYSDHLKTEQLPSQLKKTLKGKSFFLVLDDVRSVDRDIWAKFSSLLSDGAREGKIVVTTRDQSVARVVSTNHPYNLRRLINEDTLTLFKQWTFGEDVVNVEILMPIGKQIVEKCEGVVGAIRIVARLLQGKREEHQWQTLRDDFQSIFDKKGSFISYVELPFYLKPCFAYFSNLPKGFKILGIELIHQWIAQGFIQSSDKTQEPEKVGQGYISELISRSLLQDTNGYGLFSILKMHDLVHELAISPAQTEYLIVDSPEKDIPENVRHLLLLLETLMLQGCVKFEKLPKDVGKLSRLRCLEKLQCLWIDECGELEHLFDTEEVRNQHVLSTVFVPVIMNCKNLLSLPRLSSLPKLENLVIVNCEKLNFTKIDECDGGLVNLRYLWVGKLPQLVDLPGWLLGGAATTLNHLRITDCSTITTLPNDLKYLHKLSIEGCQKITSLPDGTSYLAKLEELRISECPELISRCQRERGADWHKISKVRYIFLDGINVQDSTTNELVHFRTSYHYFISFHIV